MMDRFFSNAFNTDSDAILGFLTTRQHLRPHATVRSILDQTIYHFGCCPAAIARASEWLKINTETPVGRLRRSELVQLSRVIHRFWSQATSESSVTLP